MTNRDKFHQYIRSEFERKMKVWEDMTLDEFIEWCSKGDVRIEIKIGRELCYFKLTETTTTSVGTVNDMKKWLQEGVKE